MQHPRYSAAETKPTGSQTAVRPAYITLTDPDGTPILIDRHV